MVACIGGSAGSRNITTLLVLRFFGGVFGGSPLVYSGGAIADLFPLAQRGLAMTLYCVAPFLGPILGPVVGGFVSENVWWRWMQGICCIFIGSIGISDARNYFGSMLITLDRHSRRHLCP
jgi:MFS family permease